MAGLADRVVLITGATGTTGRIVTGAFAETGARLGLVGSDQERLVAVARDLGLDQDRWVAAVGDLRQAGDARSVVGRAPGLRRPRLRDELRVLHRQGPAAIRLPGTHDGAVRLDP